MEMQEYQAELPSPLEIDVDEFKGGLEVDTERNEDFTELKEQIYQDKLDYLKQQLLQLEEETLPEYCKKLKKLETMLRERLILNDVWKEIEIEIIEREFMGERKGAVREFEEKKNELRENLIADFEERKRLIENEHFTIELTGDSMEVKPVTTRKLRRRANEPVPIAEKRQKTAPSKLNTLLDEGEASDDLRLIQKGKQPPIQYQNKKNSTAGSTCSSTSPRHLESESRTSPVPSEIINEVRIEDGKLFFEKRWYHRGQAVMVDGGSSRFPCVISAIGSDSIWVRKMSDNSKTRIFVSQLAAGKFYIQRRAV